jgi:hypothetical protein
MLNLEIRSLVENFGSAAEDNPLLRRLENPYDIVSNLA